MRKLDANDKITFFYSTRLDPKCSADIGDSFLIINGPSSDAFDTAPANIDPRHIIVIPDGKGDVDAFRKAVEKARMAFLEDQLLVYKDGNRYVYEAKDVMEAGEADIREELDGAEFVIMGSSKIGRSGLYDHLLCKVPYARLIVVTQSFESDYNLNWTYVSDVGCQPPRGIRAFCDCSADAKYFESTARSNPALSFKDGLEHMSAEDYRKFLTDADMPSEFRTDKDVNILTEKGISMAFLHIKIFTSTILDGSTLLKIEHPRDYFKANMPEYVRCVRKTFTPYYTRLKEVSTAVRSIGGTGVISGCTVEVFEKLKIVVDPVDEGLVLYRAVTKGIDYFDTFAQSEYLDDSVIESTPHLKDVLKLKAVSGNVPGHLSRKEINRMNAIADSLMYVISYNVIRRWDDRIMQPDSTLADIMTKEVEYDGA